jgi:deoxyribodipyrimidine photo-lyase
MNVFLFHRDFRLQDNLALQKLSQQCDGPIVCIFIFTPSQIKPNQNPFFTHRAFQFMCESLEELRQELRDKGSDLYTFYGETLDILKTLDIKTLAFNLDYTPYARRRDESILDYCLENKIQCITAEDYLLAPMGTFLKSDKDKTPYVVYTPFKNLALKHTVTKPHSVKIEYGSIKDKDYVSYRPTYESQKQFKGGRKEGLKHMTFTYQHDQFTRTTELSAYLKFGCISIREAYWANANPIFHQQLIWREFFYYIACYFPKVLDSRANFKSISLTWTNSKPAFEQWCKGETGYPIVDAAMRQLNQTGYMHNRGRLITANFLTRLLGIDWRWGETYYATHLIDYDPCINNGNWQWVAGTGVDRAPYSQRIFNPWIQSAKFDPDATYIKQWIPALKDVPAKHLHQWDKYFNEYPTLHPKPMIDYAEARTYRLKHFKD